MYISYLVPRMSFNLWELELCVIGVHALNLFPRWSTQNLQDADAMPQYVMVQQKVAKQWKYGYRKKITLMISTSWSTPLSPGNRGYMDECYQNKQKGKNQREGS